jgi:DNA modification methylase
MTKNDTENKIIVLGKTFNSDNERRSYFREELRKKLPELKKMEGFPIGEDEDILNLSDAPYYTACPNPWLNDFMAIWEEEKQELEKQGKRLSDFEVNEPYAADVSEGKNNPIYNAHSYHTKVPHPAIMRYILHYTQPGDIVFDGFAGTGMTGVASSMCQNPENEFKFIVEKENQNIKWGKRNAICTDLSPYASFISSNYNINTDVIEFLTEANKIINELIYKYNYLYKTDNGQLSYLAWSRVFNCKECGHETDYYQSCYNKLKDNKWVRKTSFNCENCGIENNTNNVTKAFETTFDKVTNITRSKAKLKPVLINYKVSKSRNYKEPNSVDKALIDFCIDNLNYRNVPISELKEGFNTSQPIKSHGYNYIHDFYSPRTLFLLTELYDLVNKSLFKKQLMFVFTSMLPKLTLLNRFMPEHGGRALVGPRAGTLYVPNLSIENNLFEQFDYQLKKIVQAFNIIKDSNIGGVMSATKAFIKNESIDYIFVDPPFGANIMYSELNSIPEGWLKVSTENTKEAIENKGHNKTIFDYQSLMFDSFKEYFRVLKPGKWMTVEFSNTSAAIWNTIQYSLQHAGFVVSMVSDLDKKRPGLVGMIGSTAVSQDLAITCYKPSSEFDVKFKENQSTGLAVWDFVLEHLSHLPVHMTKENTTTAIIERSPKILYDRLISFYVQRSLPVPIDAGKFQKGLRERYIERDGMFFTNEQVQEYDTKKAAVPNFTQLNIFVANEQDSIYWLRNILEKDRKTESDLHPFWMKEVAGNMRKGDTLPEMRTILEENFLKDEHGYWYMPDSENEADLEKLRNKRLLKQFEIYKAEATKPKIKIKEARVESLRAGFKQCYQDKDFKTIVTIGDRIPNNLLMEDEVLLQFYDIASSRI